MLKSIITTFFGFALVLVFTCEASLGKDNTESQSAQPLTTKQVKAQNSKSSNNTNQKQKSGSKIPNVQKNKSGQLKQQKTGQASTPKPNKNPANPGVQSGKRIPGTTNSTVPNNSNSQVLPKVIPGQMLETDGNVLQPKGSETPSPSNIKALPGIRNSTQQEQSNPAEAAPDGEGEKPEDAEKKDEYFDGTSEDVLNPFDLNSVKRHIHKLTAPEEAHKASHHKKANGKEAHSHPKPKVTPPKSPSQTPFTPEWNQAHGRRVLAIAAVMILLLFLAPPFTRKLVKYMTLGREGNEIVKRIRTNTQLFMKFTLVAILLLGILEILKEFQVDIGPMLTGAGIFGVALGFAGQNILKDLLAGTFLIVDEQVRVGDFIKVAGISGTVEEISLRKIILRDFSGNVLYVPNSKVDIVINMTREFSRYVLDIPVSYKADFNSVVKVLAEVDKEIRADEKFKKVITEPLTIYGISHFGTNGYTVTIRTTTKPGDQWMAAREYRKRIKQKFEENNIEIPLSQLTIHNGSLREGEANPVSIESLNE